MIWKSTESEAQSKVKPSQSRGYVFPYLEGRAILSLHPEVVDRIHKYDGGLENPIVHGIDGDVLNDPFLISCPGKDSTKEEQQREKQLQEGLWALQERGLDLFSGGYNWHCENWISQVSGGAVFLETIQKIIDCINRYDLAVREKLAQQSGHLIYWPEPNIYCRLENRRSGAVSAYKAAEGLGNKSQQRESTYLVKSFSSVAEIKGSFVGSCATGKPFKQKFFSAFIETLIAGLKAKNLNVRSLVLSVHQTHLNLETLRDVAKWHGCGEPSEAAKQIVEDQLNLCVQEIEEISQSFYTKK